MVSDLAPNIDHFFFFNDTATTEIYTLSLHDALPILADDELQAVVVDDVALHCYQKRKPGRFSQDRKSTRLNSSHRTISYAVFCLKKKKTHNHLSTLLLTSYKLFATPTYHHT